MQRAHGIDVSHWHPVKDWKALAASRQDFIGAKATNGAAVDPTFLSVRDGLRAGDAGPVGLAWFYAFPMPGSPEDEADRLQSVVGDLRPNEVFCLDMEPHKDADGALAWPTANPRDMLAWVTDFMAEITHGICSGRRPWLYCSARQWAVIGNPTTWELAPEVDIILARYDIHEPPVPPPWQAVGRTWTAWQNSEQYTCPGVGPCDGDVWNGARAALDAYVAAMTEPAIAQ